MVLGLSILELHLFVAVLHLHGRHLQGSASSGGSGGSGSNGVSNGANGVSGAATAGKSGGDNCAVAMVVRQALTVCDMLVEMFKQKVCVTVLNSSQLLCLPLITFSLSDVLHRWFRSVARSRR